MKRNTTPPIERGIERGPGPASRTLAAFIFASRWLQAPLYLGLIVAQAVYVVLFCVELWHLIEKSVIDGKFNEVDVMLSVLALIDIVMIANLLIMVIIGGYETFVSKIRVEGHHDEPDWLSHVNANLLKVKLAISIISISSIHLLKTFIEVGRMDGGIVRDASDKVIYSYDGVFWEVMIHLAFIVSALALALIDRMSKTEPHGGAHAAAPATVSASQGFSVGALESELRHPGGVAAHSPATASGGAPAADGYITVQLPAGAALPEGARIVRSDQE